MRGVSQIVLGAAALAAVAGAVVIMVGGSSPAGVEVVLPPAQPPAELRVYLSGAVRSPGVYVVEQGDRLADVVEAAGGLGLNADPAAVNLAVRVKDEDHWHIPSVGETPSASAGARPDAGPAGPAKVEINSADAATLQSLPGIGEVKARSIVQYREANGPFATVEGLLDIRGIGPSTLEAIRDLVEVR